jgi:arsenite methyltransferase
MKKLNAKMFNKKASNPKNKPDEIINNLKILPGQHIADKGSGGGYFSFRFLVLSSIVTQLSRVSIAGFL